MRKNSIFLALWGLLAFLAACTEDTPETPQQEAYTPLNEVTLQMNLNNIGSYTGDEGNDYFQFLENGKVSLYKKERKSGSLTLLDQREGSGSTSRDVCYTDLYLYDGHLYFTLYDCNNSHLQNVLCRVSTDGGSLMETIVSLNDTYGIQFYKDGKAYAVSPEALYEISLQDGSRTALSQMPESSYPALFVNGYLYLYEYSFTPENKFYTKLTRRKLDGSSAQVVLDNPGFQSLVLTALKDRLYFYSGLQLHSMAMNGEDLRMEQDGLEIWSVNADSDALYLLTPDVSAESALKVYAYQPESKVLQPLYQADNLNGFLMLNGYGEVILSVVSDVSRFGQLGIVRDGTLYNIK